MNKIHFFLVILDYFCNYCIYIIFYADSCAWFTLHTRCNKDPINNLKVSTNVIHIMIKMFTVDMRFLARIIFEP